ncbi:WcaF family extracellular polysaccharide biosynthesis acetyltransferase [Mucilaginibacter glaciei]|uniref:Colanic acid biosynthesis acetyltransferase WcaF n=1 Tax=Mucilaginibacter glaciei TaxID=2772109 RepID=A0A926NKI4_9SPHI|nr:WcaF family extracellular polysaccharide biosynthesis acetyltransferase [Mucilaginibacter glaciei]MBD1392916.1 colanic acid biosynthesis acetyltransferase WcaF [Mucilaginibacter glaciei]
MQKTDLGIYNNYPYNPGGSKLKRALWFYINALIFKNSLFPISGIKVAILRSFGSSIGRKVVIRHRVNIKYPWLLKVGNNSWLGDAVWIDNLVPVTIGSNVCISQAAILQTGNHNYKKVTFDLITGPIIIEDGVWIGCGAIVTAGVIAATHSVLSAGSVATKNLLPYSIYQGNPAVKVRDREIL